ncbi:hypothetical protein NVV31_17095 [Cytobacillus firmus]|uniref:hypothetical protein n=1 Tax=Cytobacillus firmus TaxID=1399 RepID=UPI0021C9AAA4|nr:hypothetical protein [Cytobacillus firmus]MCU1807105.1 hypothetical protein [Cytobacillus firmus]
MGKVGEFYNGNTIDGDDSSYYDEVITIKCENGDCGNDIYTTQYEYDSNLNDSYCLDCLTRYGSSETDFSISKNTLSILNDPEGVHKCINTYKHNVSILSDLGCFECSINSVEALQKNQSFYNERRSEEVTMGTPTEVDGILFRSKSESDLYKQLKVFDSNILYEMLFTKVKVRGEEEYYNPDFYLPLFNLFIEYRGYNAETPEQKYHWSKTYAFARKIKNGLKNHLTWNSRKKEDFCKLIVIAPREILFYEKGNEQKFKYKKCLHCGQNSVQLSIFSNKCYLCGM